ncbi:MAG TPA: lipoyl domain-containing protein [Anaerolineae bacterium]|jgi:pyruvate dehydrogenase E2 component (dihydrolipoamide acetyltransferase)|nr:lipoyl domain-containing protein [Anaerolineae bacterium]
MSTPIRMPNLGAEADAARVSSWLKSVGDTVMEGEVIAEIETEKANVDLEMPATGRLLEILVPAGTDAKVGEVLATYEEA